MNAFIEGRRGGKTWSNYMANDITKKIVEELKDNFDWKQIQKELEEEEAKEERHLPKKKTISFNDTIKYYDGRSAAEMSQTYTLKSVSWPAFKVPVAAGSWAVAAEDLATSSKQVVIEEEAEDVKFD